ncbi:hypothetical protein IP69_08440 [Bosea sp. AAP35]|uniref:hypothetical protein n=1 Tax=Bosea sp. AAP35 TaxID=1523417 RepID=UPI0006B8D8AC|nr:hypothetical protein [Bosea sp. AAP35]KPF70942.1 hypothetical protein IP69_08440 [Bosea sp. AAP35]
MSKRACVGLALIGIGSTAFALAALPGSRAQAAGAPVAIVFPPWIAAEEAVARTLSAGHLVLRSGRLASIVIAAPTPSEERPAGRPAGALMLVALVGLAGCLDALAIDRAAS